MAAKRAKAQPPRRLGSVQQRFVRLHGVSGDVLCIGGSGQPPAYVGVLEVGGISYDLHSQREQERLMDLWQQILTGCTFPIQLLWRSLPLRLDPYLQRFERASGRLDAATDVWDTLAAAHRQHVRALAARRTLVERRIYLLTHYTAEEQAHRGLKGLLWPGPARQEAAAALEEARAGLEVRLDQLTRHLELLQLSARRLSGMAELGAFYHSCLTPITAALYPLAAETLDGVDAPPQVVRRTSGLAPVVRCPGCQAQMPGGACFCGNCGTSLPGAARISRPSAALDARSRGRGQDALPDAPAPAQQQEKRVRQHPTSQEERQTLFPQLADLLAPASIEVQPDLLKVGDEWQQVLVVTGLPRVVEAGWLWPLLDLDEPFDMSFHLQPQDSVRVEDMLRRKRTQFQATKALAVTKGQLVDPHIEIAQGDIETLITRIASGVERLFDLVWVLRVWGSSKKELTERVKRLQQVLHLMRLGWRVATYEQGPGYRTCLPQVRPQLEGAGLPLPSEAIATAFPFVASSLFHEDGVLVGVTPTRELIVLDPWASTKGVANANMVIVGPPGQGKSTLVKILIERLALGYQLAQQGDELAFQAFIIDPEREYGLLAAALGGQVVQLSPGSPDTINPFDLPRPRPDRVTGQGEDTDVLAEHLLDLHALLDILIAERKADGSPGLLTQEEESIIDLALYKTYERAGITKDRQTHTQPAPLMRDFARVLETGEWGAPQVSLLRRLQWYTEGSASGLFSRPTTLDVARPVVVFDTSACRTGMEQIIAQFLACLSCSSNVAMRSSAVMGVVYQTRFFVNSFRLPLCPASPPARKAPTSERAQRREGPVIA